MSKYMVCKKIKINSENFYLIDLAHSRSSLEYLAKQYKRKGHNYRIIEYCRIRSYMDKTGNMALYISPEPEYFYGGY